MIDLEVKEPFPCFHGAGVEAARSSFAFQKEAKEPSPCFR
jgi:hypothetical protein